MIRFDEFFQSNGNFTQYSIVKFVRTTAVQNMVVFPKKVKAIKITFLLDAVEVAESLYEFVRAIASTLS